MKLLNRLSELKIARKTVAEAAGVTERTVYRWLSYEVEPQLTFDRVAELCELLGWSARELAEAYYSAEEEPMTAPESSEGSSQK